MKTHYRSKKGYTFVEVLFASALLGVILGGAVKFVGTLNTSDYLARNGAVGITCLENAAKLWQLGLTPAEVLLALPTAVDNEFLNDAIVANQGVYPVTFGSATTTTLANISSTLETITISTTIQDPAKGANTRTITVTAHRPVAR